jgi:hypothetical protein
MHNATIFTDIAPMSAFGRIIAAGTIAVAVPRRLGARG